MDMQMPFLLQDAVEKLLADMPQKAVRDAAAALSLRYRTDEKAPAGVRLLDSETEMRAYCAFRMPATYAALVRAMEMLRQSGVKEIATLTDVGSGTGSALWAADEVFGVRSAELIERESGMIALARQLAQEKWQEEIHWTQADMLAAQIPHADLVTASFCLGELNQDNAEEMVKKLWEAADRALIIAEPGTPAGYARIRRYVEVLRQLGAHMAAPCPSMGECPLAQEDWCHFTVRVERTRLHKFLKEGALPYEDEKFSFLAVTKEPAQPAQSRIRRRPLIRSGYVELPICRESTAETIRVSKKHPAYKQARKAEVGDQWEEM